MKTLSDESKMILLMARCEYIKLNANLTAKGRGLLSASGWRKWNGFLCAINPAHKKRVYDFLKDALMKETLIREGRSAELT